MKGRATAAGAHRRGWRSGRVRVTLGGGRAGRAACLAALVWLGPVCAQPGAPPVPLTEGQGSRELRQRLDQDGYANRLGPAGLEQGRAMREGFRLEWLERHAPQVRPLAPGASPAPNIPRRGLQDTFERERMDQRRHEQARQAEQARLRQRAAGPGGLAPAEAAVARQRLQSEEAAQDLGARMRRPTSPPAHPAQGPDWLPR